MDTPNISKDKNKEYKIGILSILFCQVWWGLCPVYWQALEPIDSWKIILYRVFTMFVFSYALARRSFAFAVILQKFSRSSPFSSPLKL